MSHKNEAYIFYMSLISLSTGNLQVDPTIAEGDFKVSVGGSDYSNISSLPVVEPTGSVCVKVSLTAEEMGGESVTVHCKDVAGGEWAEQLLVVETDDAAPSDLRGTVNAVVDNSNFTLIGDTLSETYNCYKDMWMVFLSGNNRCVPRLIGSYAGGASKRVQFTGTDMKGLFPNDVQPGDEWMILAGVA
jgi:hypothetical protein